MCILNGLDLTSNFGFVFKKKHFSHLCETWKAVFYPRFIPFREHFIVSLSHVTHQKWGIFSQTVFSLFYRLPMSPSLGFRLAPFNHVHELSETINRVKQVT